MLCLIEHGIISYPIDDFLIVVNLLEVILSTHIDCTLVFLKYRCLNDGLSRSWNRTAFGRLKKYRLIVSAAYFEQKSTTSIEPMLSYLFFRFIHLNLYSQAFVYDIPNSQTYAVQEMLLA